MKIFKSPQKVLILFLSILVALSSIFIVRLEIKAASFQTQWEEHQKSLKANEDVLVKLKMFGRYTGNSVLKVGTAEIVLQSGNIQSDYSWFQVDPNSILIQTKGSIKIEAVGDIDITSKNGNVNINGKKVNLNE